MKWIRLKIYLLPIIMQQVDTVTEEYIRKIKTSNLIKIELINEILMNSSNKVKITEFSLLRESVLSFLNFRF